MSTSLPSPRLGVYGCERTANQPHRGCGLWAAGYDAVISAAGGTPVPLRPLPGRSWDELLENIDGVIFAESRAVPAPKQASEERLCEWCRELSLPLLAVDHGLHVLNTTFGGTLHLDLPRELPQALQHQRLPEPGDRHAVNVSPGTHLAAFYGEGEIVVNSEHCRAVCRVARGFRVSAQALDGVIEAIEAEGDRWFALGVQWHPASASASGLDIQLFRGFLDACRERQQAGFRPAQLVAA